MPLSHRRFGLPVVAPARLSWQVAGATDVTFEQYERVKGNARMLAAARPIIKKAVDAF